MKFVTQAIQSLSILCSVLAGLLSNTVMAQNDTTPWNLGFQKIKVSDPAIQRTIDVGLWYPTNDDPTSLPLGPLELRAALNGTPIAQLKGLIALSHGFSGSMMGHDDTAQYLARQGYLVVTPTHPDRPGLQSGQPRLDPLAIRPRHLKLSIDTALNDSRFDVADSQIGVVGYSLGTYTTLTALGAEVEFTAGLADYCQQRPQDKHLCSAQARKRFSTLTPHLTPEPDQRIKAAVLLAPAYGPLFTARSLSRIDVPLQLYIAEQDQVLEHRFNSEHFKKNLPASTGFEVIPGAGHFTFMSPCPQALAQKLPALCNDADGVDRVSIHTQLNQQIADFFDRQLN